ncbi:unnamed protein product [Closterium sp. Naga37s-1]|nr:unnamed protein product [Closterium sp. Naga37s-1]
MILQAGNPRDCRSSPKPTASAPSSQQSAEPPAQQPPQLSAPPQAPPAGSGTEPSSDARNNALAPPASQEVAPPPSPAEGESVSGAAAQEEGGAETSREEAEQLSTTCGLTDYIRQSGTCDSKGRRTVSFVKARNCTDPFPVQPSQQEPCTCTPGDFDVIYTASRDGATCNMQYLPGNCTGAQQSQLIPVDKVYCSLPNAPCGEAHVDAIYSDCDFIRDSLTGLNISATRFVEVIYFFRQECDPYRRGSIHLPPTTFIPCDMQCGAGQYLHQDHCHKCPAGTYSMGGKWRFQDISEIDPRYFKTECRFTNATGTFDCDPWYADDGAFEAGAYDYINDWLPEVCASDPAYNCHNNLLSSLSLDVHLVRDGYVKFNFTVSAEMGHDGLAFYIDSLSEPLMALTSYQFEPREMVFPVEAGQHRLVWVYSKDDKWSKGEDIATIPHHHAIISSPPPLTWQYIEVDGVAFNDFLCTPCPAGFHSAEGAGACEPCPENTISKEGASECTACGSSAYARIVPRTECKPRLPCSLSDSTITYTPCQLASKKRIMKWQWIQPQICDPSNITLPMDTPLDCEPCPDGQQAEPDPHSGEIRCTLCPPGTARQASYEGGAGSAGSMLEGRCEACSSGQVAMKTLLLKHFTMQPNGALPPNFTTGCHGDCGTFGWRAFQDHLDSGSGHGPTATIWLALDVQMAVRGYMTFNYSVDILPGDPGRAFFFFIDHDLMDYVEQQRVEWEEGGEESGHPGSGEDEYRMSGMWELEVGRHSVMWVWQKLDDTGAATRTTRDSAVIYDIHVRGWACGIQIEGVAEGGAARCEEVPQGTALTEGGDSYVPCPPGTSSEGGASSCLPCPPNTFNNQPQHPIPAIPPCLHPSTRLLTVLVCLLPPGAWGGSAVAMLAVRRHPPIPPPPHAAMGVQCLQFFHAAMLPCLHPSTRLPVAILWACMPCGAGTSSLAGSTECFIGDAAHPASFCTFSLPLHSIPSTPYLGHDGGEEQAGHEGERGGVGEGGKEGGEGERGVEGEAGKGGALSPDGSGTVAAVAGNGTAAAVVFDLSPLSRMHPGRMFGPGREEGGGGQEGSGSSKARGRQAAEYFVSVCDRDSGNDTCYDYSGRSLNTYACKVQCCAHPCTPLTALHVLQSVHIPTNHMLLAMHLALGLTTALYPPALHPPHLPHSLLPCTQPGQHSGGVDPREARSGAWPGHSLGSAVAVYPLAAVHAGLYRRGLVMAFTGDECPQTNLPRETNLTFICHGQPEAWTAEGQMAALNPVLGYPQYAQRGGAVQRIEHSDCSFSLVWYSLFACPLCSHEDYERVETAECMDETRATFKWKSPRVCQLNPSNPLPPDEPCEPCKPGDIICSQGDCADADGSHNVTYSWRQPHHCSSTLPGAASLPAPELVGPCEQQWVYVPSDVLSPMWIALFVGLAVLILAHYGLCCFHVRKSRFLSTTTITHAVLRAAAFGGPAGRKAGMGVGDALVIQTALSVTLASAARRAGWISYHPERIGNENVRKAVDVALRAGDGITALGCAVIDAVKKMAGRGGNRLGRR